MKITIYTTNECVFSRQEKEYLAKNNLQFDEKNLETNKEFLSEMLTVSNNFAGTPVTKIEKDDGQIAVLKGFSQADFDKVLGLSSPTSTPSPADPSKPVEPPAVPEIPSVPPAPEPASPAPTTSSSRPTCSGPRGRAA